MCNTVGIHVRIAVSHNCAMYVQVHLYQCPVILIDFIFPAQCGLTEQAIGVIAPFRQQVWLLRETLRQGGLETVEVNTVDQYQGRDKEVIVMSFVKWQADHDDSVSGY